MVAMTARTRNQRCSHHGSDPLAALSPGTVSTLIDVHFEDARARPDLAHLRQPARHRTALELPREWRRHAREAIARDYPMNMAPLRNHARLPRRAAVECVHREIACAVAVIGAGGQPLARRRDRRGAR